jgi:hypothetical protein
MMFLFHRYHQLLLGAAVEAEGVVEVVVVVQETTQ